MCLAPIGGAIVALPRPHWSEPPTQLPDNLGRARFHVLVDSFGVVPYADIDPTTLGLGHRNVGFLSKPIEASRLAAKIRELFVSS